MRGATARKRPPLARVEPRVSSVGSCSDATRAPGAVRGRHGGTTRRTGRARRSARWESRFTPGPWGSWSSSDRSPFGRSSRRYPRWGLWEDLVGGRSRLSDRREGVDRSRRRTRPPGCREDRLPSARSATGISGSSILIGAGRGGAGRSNGPVMCSGSDGRTGRRHRGVTPPCDPGVEPVVTGARGDGRGLGRSRAASYERWCRRFQIRLENRANRVDERTHVR